MASHETPWRLSNRWYVAAWDFEVGRTPLGRTICGVPIVLYRRLDGRIVALRDACPHRLAPLSMGRVEGDNLRCRYHGMMFDAEGRCVEMPAQEGVAGNFTVAAVYPVLERYRFVWVWIGEAPADQSLPDLWPCEAEGWAFDGGVYHLNADYRLMIDNLMDLSHEAYVHADSIGQREICESPTEVESAGDEVLVSRWMLGIEAPPFWRNALRRDGLVDRWQLCRFLPPSTVMIDVGVALAGTGAPQGDRSQGVNGYVINFMSPETERTMWYFWGMARNFDIADRGFNDRFKAQQGQVFMQDVEVLEAQQRSIDANPDLKMRTFNIDAGGARSRLVLERLLREEAGASMGT